MTDAQRAAEAPAPVPSSPRRRARRWTIHILLLLAGLVLIGLAIRRVDPAAIAHDLNKLDAAAVALAFAAYVVAWGLRVWRLHYLAGAAGIPIPLAQAANTALGANALNIVAPARLGDVSAVVHLREVSGGKGPPAAATILTWRLTDLGALLTVALVAGLPLLALVPLRDGSGLAWTMAGGVAFLGLAAIAAKVARDERSSDLIDRLARRLFGSKAPMGAAFGHATALLFVPRVFLLGLLLAVGAWLADAVFAGIILHSLWPGNVLIVLVPVVLANAAKILPTTPGGVGVYEVVFQVALQQYGVDAATALTVGIATHLLLNAWTLVLGLPGAFAIGRSVSRSAVR